MTPLSAALAYQKSGLSVIPLGYKSKRPALESWDEYQRELAKPEQVEAWYRDSLLNVGIVCGAVSGNLVVLDFDSQDTLERAIEVEPSLQWATVTVKTGREEGGYQFYFKTEQPVPKSYAVWPNRIDERGRPLRAGLDIQGEGGYVVAPPSIHPNGRGYEFASEVRTIAKVPNEFLRNLMDGLGVTFSKDARVEKAGSKHGSDWISRILSEGSPHGSRNQDLISMMGYLSRRLPEDICLSVATLWWHRLSDTQDFGLAEVERTVRSAYRYHPDEAPQPPPDPLEGLDDL